MPISLKSKLKKFKYNGQITNEEYEDVIEKLVGHDKHLRNDVIDEFAEEMKELVNKWIEKGVIAVRCIDEIAERLKGE
jgi:hypothetical protein